MPMFRMNDEAIEDLIRYLRGIATILARLTETEPHEEYVGEARYDLGEVAKQFGIIHQELEESGPHGIGAYERFPTMAKALRSAADALSPPKRRSSR